MSNEDHQQGRFPERSGHRDHQGGPDGGQGHLDLPDAFVQDGPHEYPQSGDQGYAAGTQDYPGYQDHGQDFPYEYGGWQPTAPDYDSEATGFFQLPTEDSPAAAPLEAPGHGYVPPMIMPLKPLAPEAGTDPAATGGWAQQSQSPQQQQDAGTQAEPSAPESVPWPEPGAQQHGDPQATGEWTFPEEPAPAPAQGAAGHEMTGQWSIPIAEGDLPDESGEFLRSAPPVAETPWAAAEPPATLPGGAPAPWATLPGGAPAPWADQVPQEQTPQQEQVAHEPEVRESSPGEAAPEVVSELASGPEEAERPQLVAEPASPATTRVPEPREDQPDQPEQAAPQPSGDAPSGEPPTAEPPAGESTGDSDEASAGEPHSGASPAEEATGTGTETLPAADEHPPTSYVLRVNGTDRPVTDAWIGESLLYVLRERLGLAGAKDGCSQGECGACNVQVDGRLVASCLVPAATAAGSEVRTVEGLARDGEPSDVQRALANCGAVQCGYCIPGMAMTVHDLLEGNHAPTELETRQALCGNLCRCSGYQGVLQAVREVVAERAASAAAAAEEAPPEPHEEAHEEVRIPHQAPPGAGRVQAHPHDGGMA